jgi:hypothetical protein
MTRLTVLALVAGVTFLVPGSVSAQTKQYALESVEGLRLHNVTAEPGTLQGKNGLRLTISGDAARRLDGMQPGQPDLEQLAWIEGVLFSNGVIEAEVAGTPSPTAAQGARGFVGVAFRLQEDKKTYDAFYLRPTNGLQYISHPDWPWFRLRKETPSRYESYVDLVPATWTKIKIEVRGERARLYVHDGEQPTLIVNDLKTGASAKGAVALWLGPGTVAHFRNLTIRPDSDKP